MLLSTHQEPLEYGLVTQNYEYYGHCMCNCRHLTGTQIAGAVSR